ncbi:hypothetical protein IAR50_006096 [Cryptococcus sp. DSM 104548]
MIRSLTSRLSWKKKTSSEDPSQHESSNFPKHETPVSRCTTDDGHDEITLIFPAEIEYTLDTRPSHIGLVSKPDPSMMSTSSTSSQKQKQKDDKWMADSSQDWYVSSLAFQAGTIGDPDTRVTPLVLPSQGRIFNNFPTPTGDLRKGRLSGTLVCPTGQETLARDSHHFHSTEREYFQSLEEEDDFKSKRRAPYKLLHVEMDGDPIEGSEGDTPEAFNEIELLNTVESGDTRLLTVWKRYRNARWTFGSEL